MKYSPAHGLPKLVCVCLLLATGQCVWGEEGGLATENAAESDSVPISEASPELAVEAGQDVPLRSEPAPERSSLQQMAERCFGSLLRPDRQMSERAYCDVLVDELNRNLSRSPADDRLLVAAYHNRAVLSIRSREFEQATSDLEAALGLQPELAELYLTRGNLYLAWNRFAEAIDDYTTAFELSAGGLTAARRNRALAWRGLGNLDAAALDWNAASIQALNRGTDDAASAFNPGDTGAQPSDEYR